MLKDNLENSVVICALARDCEDQLRKNIPRIEELRKYFSSSYVVVVENDSKDLTKQLLQEWELTNVNVKIISNDFNTITIPKATQSSFDPSTSMHRVSKMASYRNMYLDYIETLPKVDLVIMIDIDITDFEPRAILTSLQHAPEDWGGIFSFGYTDSWIFGKKIKDLYHDLYALKIKGPTSNIHVTFAEMFRNSKVISRLLKKNSFVTVLSAFGGIGLYKYEALKSLRYTALYNNDPIIEAVCEHIPINYEIIKKGYKNYICSRLKVYYGSSNKIMVLRSILPLKLFKLLAFIITFKKLKA